MRAAKVQASLRIRAVSPEPSLLAHTSSESRGTFRQKARSLAPLNGWACAIKICHDGMLIKKKTINYYWFKFHFSLTITLKKQSPTIKSYLSTFLKFHLGNNMRVTIFSCFVKQSCTGMDLNGRPVGRGD